MLNVYMSCVGESRKENTLEMLNDCMPWVKAAADSAFPIFRVFQ